MKNLKYMIKFIFEIKNYFIFLFYFKNSGVSIDVANNSFMANTTECTAMFEWKEYKYLLIGIRLMMHQGKILLQSFKLL